MNKIDLHMHSKHSLDGEKEVQDLIDMALQQGVHTIAIADHNTTHAYQDHYDLKGIQLLPAIELDCTFMDKDFHLLGYHINPFDPLWERVHKQVETMEKTAGVKRLTFIREEMGIFIDQAKLDALCPNGVYEAESVCEVALQDERNKENAYLKEYYEGGLHSISPYVDFFWDYCAKGKLAYAEINFMSMQEAIAIYREQKATIILAHPGNNVKEDADLLKAIVDLGIDGLEVYSSYHTPQQIAYYQEFAKQNNVLATCGSDYHGKTKPHVTMGLCHMPEEEETILIKAMQKGNEA